MPIKEKPRTRPRGATTAKGKRGRKGSRADGPTLPSVANHPRGGEQVRRAKAWAGLGGFVLVALLSWSADVPIEDTLLRALAGGIICYLVTWAVAVAIWRNLVTTELRVMREQREQEAAERAAARAAAAEADDEAAPAA
jgi:hypothetical protein